MKYPGKIIEGFDWPATLEGGKGGLLFFSGPPEFHILQYNVPFMFGGKVFWFREAPLKRESCAYLHIHLKRRTEEIKVGIPFYIKNGMFTILERPIGPTRVHVVRQTYIF
ncbi:MAG: hypothetical protein V3574_02575 [Candidatus Moraniibacteriota bacterium]